MERYALLWLGAAIVLAVLAVFRGLLIGMHVPSNAISPFGQVCATAIGAPITAHAVDSAAAAAESRAVRNIAARIARFFLS